MAIIKCKCELTWFFSLRVWARKRQEINHLSICPQPLYYHSHELAYSEVWRNTHTPQFLGKTLSRDLLQCPQAQKNIAALPGHQQGWHTTAPACAAHSGTTKKSFYTGVSSILESKNSLHMYFTGGGGGKKSIVVVVSGGSEYTSFFTLVPKC